MAVDRRSHDPRPTDQRTISPTLLVARRKVGYMRSAQWLHGGYMVATGGHSTLSADDTRAARLGK